MSSVPQSKTCPFCKEEISIQDTKCPYCAEVVASPPSATLTDDTNGQAGRDERTSSPPQPQQSSTSRSPRINLTVAVVSAVLAIAALGGFYVWSSHNRFYIMAGSQGVAYEVDRKTGETWMLRGANKTPHKWPQRNAKLVEELPSSESVKVTGNASLGSGVFSGKVYNGSRWTVTKLIVTVTAKEENGDIRWSRDFAEDGLEIRPLTTGSFYISVAGDQGTKESSWSIKGVWGYRE